MWKAAFSGRSETGSVAGRSNSQKKKSSGSVVSSAPRDDRKKSGKSSRGSTYDDYEDRSAYVTAPSSRVGEPRGLTESAVQALSSDEMDWEDDDKDARSERRSVKSSKSGRSDRHRRKSERSRSRSREREGEREKGLKEEKRKSSRRESELSKGKSRSGDVYGERAIPEMGSFEQFPGQYSGGIMGGQAEYMMAGGASQGPPETPNQQFGPTREDSYGHASSYYLDEGQSVSHQPGVRTNSPNMLVNPDHHLHAASLEAKPAEDTGHGSAADFFTGDIPMTEAPQPINKPGKQPAPSSSSSKPSKPGRTSSLGSAAAATAAVGMAAAAGSSPSNQYHKQSSSTSNTYQKQQSGGSLSSRPGRKYSEQVSPGSVTPQYPPPQQTNGSYYGPPPGQQGQGTPLKQGANGAYYGTSSHQGSQSTPTRPGMEGSYYGSSPGRQSGGKVGKSSSQHPNAGMYAAGAAAAGLAGYAAYETNQNYQQKHSQSQPYGSSQYTRLPGYAQSAAYTSGSYADMQQQRGYHEHRGPITKLKDGFLNLLSTDEDVVKMEAYTEAIGVCKHCFDPRSSPWDAPRRHHYHSRSPRRDSFEDLRRRHSLEKLRKHGSREHLAGRVDKDSRYFAADSKRKSGSKADLAAAGLAGVGLAAGANALFNSGKDFEDTYSVKSGHRASSARRRGSSSSTEHRRKSEHGVIGRDAKDEFVFVRTKDGRTEKRRVQRSRSRSNDRRSNLMGAAAGAALGASAVAASSSRRRHSRSRSRSTSPGLTGILSFSDTKSKRGRHSPNGSFYGASQRPHREEQQTSSGMFGGFFTSPPPKRRNSRRGHHKQKAGFFNFGNGSSSSSDNEMAFGDGFSSKTNLPLRRKSSNRSVKRKSSDQRLAATVAGIGATAAALAAAQRGNRITKRTSRPELGAKRRQVVQQDPSDEDWEDELPSDASSGSSLAFGDDDYSRRLSRRQSKESVNSTGSGAGGLSAWGWRWGGKKDKKRRKVPSPPPAYPPRPDASVIAPTAAAAGIAAVAARDATRPSSYDSRGSSISGVPQQPMQFVDPRPVSEESSVASTNRFSMPGSFDIEEPPVIRPGPAPLQQPRPVAPIQPAFTERTSNEDIFNDRPKPRRTMSSPTQSSFGMKDAALIGAAAIGTASIIASQGGRRSREPKDVRFGLTDEQQAREDRDKRREREKAERAELAKADRERALKEEAMRFTREQDVLRRRIEENQRAAEAQIERERETERQTLKERELEELREAERLGAFRREEEARKTEEVRRLEALRREQEARQAEESRRQDEARKAEEIRRQDEARRRREAEIDAEIEAKRRELEEERSRKLQRRDPESDVKPQRRDSQSDERSERRDSQGDKKSDRSSNIPWGAVAAGTAAAVTAGAVYAGSEREKDRESTDRSNAYTAREIIPTQESPGLADHDVFDPAFFKRRRSPNRSASGDRQVEDFARRAYEKIRNEGIDYDAMIAEKEQYYHEPQRSQADVFAPKEILDRKAGYKEHAPDPVGGYEVRVVRDGEGHVFDAELYGPKSFERSRHAPYGVPKMGLIAPTPPPEVSVKEKNRRREQSPLARAGVVSKSEVGTKADQDRERDEEDYRDTRSEPGSGRKSSRSRSISWGEPQTHVYEVRTPESHRESVEDFFAAKDIGAAAGVGAAAAAAAVGGAAVYAESEEKPDKPARDERSSGRRDTGTVEEVTNITDEADSGYRKPFFESVSDLGFMVDSPGTEGAPPVRGFVEGEVDQTANREERGPHIPGGWDDEPKQGEYFDAQPGPVSSATREVSVEEPAWEPPLSKKDKKKRDKAAASKRGSSTFEEELPIPPAAVVAEPEAVVVEPARVVEEEVLNAKLSKKDKKKRDKAKRGSILEDDFPTSPVAEPEPAPVSADFSTPVAEAEVPYELLSKKEQKKRDKAKRTSMLEEDLPPQAATEPETLRELALPVEDEVPYELLSKKDKKKRDKLKRSVSEDIASPPPEPEEVVAEREPQPDWEPPLSKKEQKKREKEAAKKQGLADVASAAMTTAGIAAVAGAASAATEDDGEAWDTPSTKKGKKGKKVKAVERDIRDIEPTAKSMPGGWEMERTAETPPEVVDPFQFQVKDGSPSPPTATPAADAAKEVEPADEFADFTSSKKSKKKAKRDSLRFNEPGVSSPLRAEVDFDDYIGGQAKAGAETPRTNGHLEEVKPSGDLPVEERSSRSTKYEVENRPLTESPRRISPDDVRSVASEPTGARERRRRSKGDYRTSDYYEEGETDPYDDVRSVAASEPADLYEKRKSKRRSRAEDDDTTSVVSSRSRRGEKEKEDEGKKEKEKKGGFFGGLFGKKASPPEASKADGAALSRTSTRESKDGYEQDGGERRHRRRRSEYGEDEDDTRSVTSESRHRHHHRRRTDEEIPRSGSESGSRHHHRRRTDDSSSNGAKDHEQDQSFLGMRVEDMPPLPVSRPASPTSVGAAITGQGLGSPGFSSAEREAWSSGEQRGVFQGPGETVQAVDLTSCGYYDGDDGGMRKVERERALRSLGRAEGVAERGLDVTVADELVERKRPTPEMVAAQETIVPDMEEAVQYLPALPESPPDSPTEVKQRPYRPMPLQRPTSTTAVPLRFPFGQSPSTPGHGRMERAISFGGNLPSSSTPSTPQQHKTRQGRPTSTEMMPLYLVERTRTTPVVEEGLPSLPSSKPSSRASSIVGSDEWEDAEEEFVSPGSWRSWGAGMSRGLAIDTAGANANAGFHDVRERDGGEDFLDSGQTTPRASERVGDPFADAAGAVKTPRQEPEYWTWRDFEQQQQSPREKGERAQPQFYTWEDYERDEALHRQGAVEGEREEGEELPALPPSRPGSRTERRSASGGKGVAAAALAGAAAVVGYSALKDSKEAADDYATRHVVTTDDPPLPFEVGSLSKQKKKKGKKGKKGQQQQHTFDDEPEESGTLAELPRRDTEAFIATEKTMEEGDVPVGQIEDTEFFTPMKTARESEREENAPLSSPTDAEFFEAEQGPDRETRALEDDSTVSTVVLPLTAGMANMSSGVAPSTSFAFADTPPAAGDFERASEQPVVEGASTRSEPGGDALLQQPRALSAEVSSITSSTLSSEPHLPTLEKQPSPEQTQDIIAVPAPVEASTAVDVEAQPEAEFAPLLNRKQSKKSKKAQKKGGAKKALDDVLASDTGIEGSMQESAPLEETRDKDADRSQGIDEPIATEQASDTAVPAGDKEIAQSASAGPIQITDETTTAQLDRTDEVDQRPALSRKESKKSKKKQKQRLYSFDEEESRELQREAVVPESVQAPTRSDDIAPEPAVQAADQTDSSAASVPLPEDLKGELLEDPSEIPDVPDAAVAAHELETARNRGTGTGEQWAGFGGSEQPDLSTFECEAALEPQTSRDAPGPALESAGQVSEHLPGNDQENSLRDQATLASSEDVSVLNAISAETTAPSLDVQKPFEESFIQPEVGEDSREEPSVVNAILQDTTQPSLDVHPPVGESNVDPEAENEFAWSMGSKKKGKKSKKAKKGSSQAFAWEDDPAITSEGQAVPLEDPVVGQEPVSQVREQQNIAVDVSTPAGEPAMISNEAADYPAEAALLTSDTAADTTAPAVQQASVSQLTSAPEAIEADDFWASTTSKKKKKGKKGKRVTEVEAATPVVQDPGLDARTEEVESAAAPQSEAEAATEVPRDIDAADRIPVVAAFDALAIPSSKKKKKGKKGAKVAFDDLVDEAEPVASAQAPTLVDAADEAQALPTDPIDPQTEASMVTERSEVVKPAPTTAPEPDPEPMEATDVPLESVKQAEVLADATNAESAPAANENDGFWASWFGKKKKEKKGKQSQLETRVEKEVSDLEIPAEATPRTQQPEAVPLPTEDTDLIAQDLPLGAEQMPAESSRDMGSESAPADADNDDFWAAPSTEKKKKGKKAKQSQFEPLGEEEESSFAVPLSDTRQVQDPEELATPLPADSLNDPLPPEALSLTPSVPGQEDAVLMQIDESCNIVLPGSGTGEKSMRLEESAASVPLAREDEDLASTFQTSDAPFLAEERAVHMPEASEPPVATPSIEEDEIWALPVKKKKGKKGKKEKIEPEIPIATEDDAISIAQVEAQTAAEDGHISSPVNLEDQPTEDLQTGKTQTEGDELEAASRKVPILDESQQPLVVPSESAEPLSQPAEDAPADFWPTFSKKNKKSKKGKHITNDVPSTTIAENTPVAPVDTVEEQFATPAETPTAEAEDPWALPSKNKKGKKSMAVEQLSLSNDLPMEDVAPMAAEGTTEEPAAVPAESLETQQPTPAIEEDDMWDVPSKKKKGKKGKKSQLEPEESSTRQVAQNEEPEVVQPSNDPLVQAATDEVQPAASIDDDVCTAPSKKKKGKKGRNSGTQTPVTLEEPDASSSTSQNDVPSQILDDHVRQPDAAVSQQIYAETPLIAQQVDQHDPDFKSGASTVPASAEEFSSFPSGADQAVRPTLLSDIVDLGQRSKVADTEQTKATFTPEKDAVSSDLREAEVTVNDRSDDAPTLPAPIPETTETRPEDTFEQDGVTAFDPLFDSVNKSTLPTNTYGSADASAIPVQEQPSEQVQTELDAPAQIATASVDPVTRDVEAEPTPAGEDADSFWALPSKKRKKGKKSRQSTMGVPDAVDENAGAPEPVAPVEAELMEIDTESAVVSHGTSTPAFTAEPLAENAESSWAAPAEGRKGKKGNKAKRATFDFEDAPPAKNANTVDVAKDDMEPVAVDRSTDDAFVQANEPSESIVVPESTVPTNAEAVLTPANDLASYDPTVDTVRTPAEDTLNQNNLREPAPITPVEVEQSRQEIETAAEETRDDTIEAEVQSAASGAAHGEFGRSMESEGKVDEPVKDTSFFVPTKKSKKDKKGKKVRSATDAWLEEPSPSAAAPPTENDAFAAATGALTDGALAAAGFAASAPGIVAEEPAKEDAEEWPAFSTKKSKKDKRKGKKSGAATPGTPLEEERIRSISEATSFPTATEVADFDQASLELQGRDSTKDAQASAFDATPIADVGPKELSVADVERSAESYGSDSRKTDAQRDIDFTATVAAGLQDTGFDPEMVVNDPVFHRRATPPGGAGEADPEEGFGSFSTKKKRKGKKGKQAENTSDEQSRDVSGGQTPREAINEFDAVLARSLEGTGLDATALNQPTQAEDATSSNDLTVEGVDYSFATTKRKKGKKRAQAIEEAPAVETSSSPVNANEPISAIDEEPAPDRAAGDVVPSDDTAIPPASAQEAIESPSRPDLSRQLTVETNATETTSTLTSAPGTPLLDPAADLVHAGERDMDVDDMDKAYRAYKRNKRKQKKQKWAALQGEESASETPQEVEENVPHLEGSGPQVISSEAADAVSGQREDDNIEQSDFAATTRPAARDLPEFSARPLSSFAEDAGGLLHTSEISQSLPTAPERTPSPPTSRALSSDVANNMSPAGRSLSGTEAAGLGAAITTAGVGAGVLWQRSSRRDRDGRRDSSDNADSPMPRDKEHQVIRDSGYQETSSPRWSRRSEDSSHRAMPDMRAPKSKESLHSRRSNEALYISTDTGPNWDLQMPKKRAVENDNDESQTLHARTPSQTTQDTPLEPTSRNRASYLFQTTPEGLRSAGLEADATPLQASSSEQKGYFPAEVDDRTPGRELSHSNPDRAAFSPPPSGMMSPRIPLDTIPEEHLALKRSIGALDANGPDHKAIRRTETPQSIRARERALSPTALPPLQTSSTAARSVSNPAIDELARPSDVRSPSVMSSRSNVSANHWKSPDDGPSYSRTSNRSTTPILKRTSLSGDLRAASRRGDSGSSVGARSSPKTIPVEAPPTPPSNDDEVIDAGASRSVGMSDIFQGYGDAQGSQVSPTRPPSMRKRQSMHIVDLESKLEQLAAENQALQSARQDNGLPRGPDGQSLEEALRARDLEVQQKDNEINQIRAMLQPMQDEIARLTEMNDGLTEANRNLVDDSNSRYAGLQQEHAEAHEQWQSASRELSGLREEHGQLTSGLRAAVEAQLATALASKNSEIRELKEELDVATEKIRALQVQIQSTKGRDFLTVRDEDYFDGACQKLCQHVQQWVLRFSKVSDKHICRLSTDLKDDKVEARLDNAVLDGSDVDKLLGDRVKRRDVFMSVVMTMVWEYVFTRYLFGMDREQRQKLKALEKLLSEVGPPRAVAQWRATTLTLLAKRSVFTEQRDRDELAVASEIFELLCALLPPPSSNKEQLLSSLQRVVHIAVDLSIEMRTQRSEYIMLPPLLPEYDTNGDLLHKVHFNASLMNERSGMFSSNEELEQTRAVVKIVLFPLVVKKGDEAGEGEEEIVVCPAQVLVHNDNSKGKKVVRVESGHMTIDDPRRSRASLASGTGSFAF